MNSLCKNGVYCVQHVKLSDRHLHNECLYQAKDSASELNPCRCRMLSESQVSHCSNRPRVALVSLPGSGNTWVRGLLEQATGYCTGSMWCDPILRAKQFCGEGVRSNTLVVKNHDPTIRWAKESLPLNASKDGITNLNKPMFNSAIFVHRDPYEATIAEWNRALGSRVYNATKHNQTVTGIGFYNVSGLKDQHTVSFGKEAFGMFHLEHVSCVVLWYMYHR